LVGLAGRKEDKTKNTAWDGTVVCRDLTELIVDFSLRVRAWYTLSRLVPVPATVARDDIVLQKYDHFIAVLVLMTPKLRVFKKSGVLLVLSCSPVDF
jgi:hypothetical protein